jgi:hypothetical protein
VKSFGLGDFLGYDLSEKETYPILKRIRKFILTADGGTTIISNSIGQVKF